MTSWTSDSPATTDWLVDPDVIILSAITYYDTAGQVYDTEGITYDWNVDASSANRNLLWSEVPDVTTSWTPS
jgi:hypothetical protein